MRIVTWVSCVIVLASLGLVAAGCGGKKAVANTSTLITTNPTDSASAQEFIKAFATPTMCGKFRTIADSYSHAVETGGNYNRFGDKLAHLLAGAPEEIQDDFSVMAQACGFLDLVPILKGGD